MSWRTCRLGDVLKLQRGHDLPSDRRVDGDVPVVSSSGITGYHNQAKAEAPGVVTGRYGTLGEVFYVDQPYWPLNTALYVVDFKGCHPRFAAYFLRNVLRNYQSDKAAVPGVDRNVLHQLEVRVPERKKQEAITGVLSAYDDLIENNTRRIELLEQATRLLYEEWFVRLRFPGREHTRLQDGLPQGWVRTTAYEAMDILSGGTPSTQNAAFWNGDIPFFTPKDAPGVSYAIDTEKHITDLGLANCHSRLYPKDTLFISARGTVGKLALAQRPMAMNQSCYALVAKQGLSQRFLYLALLSSIEQFRSRAVGSVFDAIIIDTFKLIPLVRPELRLVLALDEIVQPMFRQVETLLRANQKLSHARDLLLPRLMSGEIAV